MWLAAVLLPLLWVVPALLSLAAAALAVCMGHSIEWLEPAPDGLRVILAGPDGSIARNLPLDLRMAAAIAGAAIALWMRRVNVALAALGLMAIGRAASAGLSFEAMFQQRPWAVAAVAAWMLVAALGVHWSVSSDRLGGRLLQALIIFALPVALHQAWQFTGFGFRRLPPLGMAMLAGGILPVAALGALRKGAAPLGVRRKWMVAAGVAAILIPVGVSAGGSYSRQAQRTRLQAELARVPQAPPPASYERLFFQRGVSFVRDGFAAYYPERSARMLDSLRTYGVDAVALIPYGRADAHGGPVRFEADDETRDIYVAMGHLARARGVRILLKPQLLVFGPGLFPGVIEPPNAVARAEWFASYRKYILHWAGIAAQMHADLFCVGTELARLSRYQAEWRELIGEVRRVYSGPLVYAATQGEEFEQVRFWDALDYIGLNNYYPLPDSLDASAVVRKVEAVQARFAKPVIFTELGFASVDGSHREPWAEPRAPVSLEHQRRCYQAVYEAFYRKPWFYGMYWWKISADGRGGPDDRSLTPWRKPAMDVVRQWYTGVQPERIQWSRDSNDGTADQGRSVDSPAVP